MYIVSAGLGDAQNLAVVRSGGVLPACGRHVFLRLGVVAVFLCIVGAVINALYCFELFARFARGDLGIH